MNDNITYKKAFRRICSGFCMLLVCTFRSFLKYKLQTFLTVSIFGNIFLLQCYINAKVNYDKADHETVLLEQKIDSLEMKNIRYVKY